LYEKYAHYGGKILLYVDIIYFPIFVHTNSSVFTPCVENQHNGWQATTLKSHNFFIQNPFWMKLLRFGSKSGLVYVVKIAYSCSKV